MAITSLQVAILPSHTGVSGVAPWAAISIWVSAIILPQVPTKVSILYSHPCHRSEENLKEHFRKQVCNRVSIHHLSCTSCDRNPLSSIKESRLICRIFKYAK